MSVCAETIYRACYANDLRSGLPAGSWEKLPRRARPPRAPRPAHCEAQPRSGIQADSRPARRRRGPHAARALGRRPHRRQGQPHRCGPRSPSAPAATRSPRRCPTATARRKSPRRVAAALGCQPAALVRSLTWDQGREMAPPGPTSKQRSASKCSSASRARHGNGPPTSTPNGLLRRWLPKGTSLDIGQLRLAVIEDKPQHDAPADSTTGHQHTTSTLSKLATTDRACPPCRVHTQLPTAHPVKGPVVVPEALPNTWWCFWGLPLLVSGNSVSFSSSFQPFTWSSISRSSLVFRTLALCPSATAICTGKLTSPKTLSKFVSLFGKRAFFRVPEAQVYF